MIHEMRLEPEIFERINSGMKTLEIRLYDEKRRMIKLGDEIDFLKRPNFVERVKTEVVGLLLYKTFDELIFDQPAKFLGYEESDKSKLIGSMREFYSEEDEKKYGVVGIRIGLL